MVSIVSSIVDFLKSIGNSISNLPIKIFSFFSSVFDSILDGIGSIVDFFKNILIFIKDIFVPSNNYFSDKFNAVKTSFFDKFKFITQIDSVIGALGASNLSDEVYAINLPFDATIDFSWYEPYRQNFKNILMGAFSLIFIGAIVKRNDPKINMGG